jgi:hypothetical protein
MKNELWDPQLFKNDVGLLLGQFHDDFTKDFNNLHQSQWKNNMYKLVNLDLTQVHERSVDKITSIEQCLRENAGLLLFSADKYSSNFSELIQNVFYDGFLFNEINQDLNNIISQYADLQISAGNLLAYVENNSGFTGFLRGVFKGHSKPAESLLNLTKNTGNKLSKKQLQNHFSAIAITFSSSVDVITNKLKQLTLNSWNYGSTCLMEM